MATAGKSPRNADFRSNDGPVSQEQLRRDRFNLVLVVVVFGVLIGLMVWLASISPSPGGFDSAYPMFP